MGPKMVWLLMAYSSRILLHTMAGSPLYVKPGPSHNPPTPNKMDYPKSKRVLRTTNANI